MKSAKAQCAKAKRIGSLGMAVVFCGLAGGPLNAQAGARAQSAQEKTTPPGAGAMNTQNKFYCNIKALTPAEREHHKQLSEKLQAARKATVETAKGYEFQFSPADVSLAELSDWVLAESRCCPFFDFHLDLENEGTLLCLRLTGVEGVKAFIRDEFHVTPAHGAS